MTGTPSDQALVPFVSVEKMLTLTHLHGIDRCLTELADAIAADFGRWEAFDETPRIAAHSAKGVIELMPVSDGTDYAFKFVDGHPSNTRLGLQAVTAFGALASVETGCPTLFSEMTLLTALRTAATSPRLPNRRYRRQRRAVRVSNSCLVSRLWNKEFSALRHRSDRDEALRQ